MNGVALQIQSEGFATLNVDEFGSVHPPGVAFVDVFLTLSVDEVTAAWLGFLSLVRLFRLCTVTALLT